ncbi:MAG: hypothetical protein AABY15_02920 [Nanoarchaeota archaeon]
MTNSYHPIKVNPRLIGFSKNILSWIMMFHVAPVISFIGGFLFPIIPEATPLDFFFAGYITSAFILFCYLFGYYVFGVLGGVEEVMIRNNTPPQLKKPLLLEDKSETFPMYEEFYGKYVQMDDRFETVHIWSQELAIRNEGTWEPKLITEEQYQLEKVKSWNQ